MAPHFSLSRLTACLLLSLAACLPARATDVLSYHNDQQSTGQNLTETQLNPSTVAGGSFKKHFSTPLDGQVYAQPLYLPLVNITVGANQGAHDTVFVATEHDSLYAIDASNGTILWHTNLATNGVAGATQITSVPSKWVSTGDLTPEIGVTSTPVIDRQAKVIYVEAKTMQTTAASGSAHFVHTLFKISIESGTILAHRIVGDTITNLSSLAFTYRTNTDPSAEQDPFVFGTGDGSINVGGTHRVYFNALREANRPGLLLYNGIIYIAYASHGDVGPYHGWILGFNAATLTPTVVFNDTPNGGLGGIWQAGGILAVDSDGSFYVETGNGTFDGDSDGHGGITGLDQNGFPNQNNYGDCFLKLTLDNTSTQANQNPNGWGMKVVDYFAPMDNQSLDQRDADLGSGGLVILPNSVGNVLHPHLLVGAGKEGIIYLVDRDNMGKFDPATDHVVQKEQVIGGSFSTPAYFNGSIYWGGVSDTVKVFPIASAGLSSSPTSATLDNFGYPGSTPSISANGANNGIVWTIDLGSNELRAYDASDLSNRLWTSDDTPNGADRLGSAVKFIVPTVADGRVLVGVSKALVCYGLPASLLGPPAAPTTLTARAISGDQVLLKWTNKASNADGYSIEQSTDGTNFSEVQTVGSTVHSTFITGLDISTIYYFRVRAFNSFNSKTYSGYSNIASVATEDQPPTLDFSNGFGTSQSLLNFAGSAAVGANNTAVLTDGNMNEAGAIWSKSRQTVGRFTCQFTFQATNAVANGFTFCLQNAGKIPVGPDGQDLGYTGIKHSVAIKFDFQNGANATGLYENGAQPAADGHAVDMGSAGIDLHSGDIFLVWLVYDDGLLTETVTDTQTNATFTYTYPPVNIPKAIGSGTAFVGFTGGTGSQTATESIRTWHFAPIPAHAPAPPATPTAKVASATEIDLHWKDQSGNEAGFVVERRIGKTGPFTQLAVVGTGTVTYIDAALTSNTTYSYRVRATNAAGESAPSAIVSATPPSIPAAPSDAQVTLLRDNRVGLSWTDNATNETGYQVFRSIGSSPNYQPISGKLPKNAHSFVDTKVSGGTAYHYHIQAFNAAGPSNYADVDATTP